MTARENEDGLAPWSDWDRILPRSGYSIGSLGLFSMDETGRVDLRVSASKLMGCTEGKPFQEAALPFNRTSKPVLNH
jgi:hypothetical protein